MQWQPLIGGGPPGGSRGDAAVHTGTGVARPSSTAFTRAHLSATTRSWPFSVPGFWDKTTGICASAMPHRRDSPATTRI